MCFQFKPGFDDVYFINGIKKKTNFKVFQSVMTSNVFFYNRLTQNKWSYFKRIHS